MANTPNLNVPIAQSNDAVDRAHYNTAFADADAAMGAHRASSPLDHADGSVTSAKLAPAIDVQKTLRAQGAAAPVGGAGLEMDYGAIEATTGRIFAYDRTLAAYLDLVIGKAIREYAGGGVYIGDVPGDPGPNNLRVQNRFQADGQATFGNRIIAASVGASGKPLLNPVIVTAGTPQLISGSGNVGPTNFSVTGLPASAVAVFVTMTLAGSVAAIATLYGGQAGAGPSIATPIMAPVPTAAALLPVVAGASNQMSFAVTSNSGAFTITLTLTAYWEPA